jgi:hypothetical protein
MKGMGKVHNKCGKTTAAGKQGTQEMKILQFTIRPTKIVNKEKVMLIPVCIKHFFLQRNL